MTRHWKTALVCALSLALGLTLAGCQRASLKENLIGKWRRIGSNSTVQFFKTGDAALTNSDGTSVLATYSWVDDTHIRFEGTGRNAGNPRLLKIYIEGDRLIDTDAGGTVEQWDRVKE